MDKSAKRNGIQSDLVKAREISPSKNLQGQGDHHINSNAEASSRSASKERHRQHSPKRSRSPRRDDGESKLDDKLGHSKSEHGGSKKGHESPKTPDYDWAHKRRGTSPVRIQEERPDFRWDKSQQEKRNDVAAIPSPSKFERCVTR